MLGAYLRGADLREADLRGAVPDRADLRGADLSEAKVTPEQLSQAWSLQGATLPDGIKDTRKEPAPAQLEAEDTERLNDLDAAGDGSDSTSE